MTKQRSRGGYILPMTLLVLACTLLWGCELLLTVSDQYAASDDMVKHEQSRLLAGSGWNLALNQLEENGSMEAIQLETSAGNAAVEFQMEEENQIRVVSSAKADDYPSVVEGTVSLLKLPWVETAEWEVCNTLQDLKQPGIFCANGEQMVLSDSIAQPLALTSKKSDALTVSVREPLCCTALYVHGDLIIEEDAFLEAEAVYASGTITGSERIAGSIVLEQYTSGTDYHVQLVERFV